MQSEQSGPILPFAFAPRRLPASPDLIARRTLDANRGLKLLLTGEYEDVTGALFLKIKKFKQSSQIAA